MNAQKRVRANRSAASAVKQTPNPAAIVPARVPTWLQLFRKHWHRLADAIPATCPQSTLIQARKVASEAAEQELIQLERTVSL